MRKHTRWYSVPLVLLSFAAASLAQQPAPAAAPKVRRILMFKATSPTNTVYLLGSIHAADERFYPLPDAVESAFASSKILAVEANAKSLDMAKMAEMVQKYGMYSADDGLSKHVPKETADAAASIAEKNGIPGMAVERMKPWLASLTLVALAVKQAGEKTDLGIDMHFLNAVKAPQRIDELEGFEYQFQVLGNATEQEQQEMLVNTVKKFDKTAEDLAKLENAYLTGDSEEILKVIHEDDTGPKSLNKKLIDDRNVGMTEKVEAYLKGKDQCFVVVGAAHILGDKGIAKLLRDKGYKVEQITAVAK